MYSLLFRNRWFALGWVFLMIFSVITFFAKGGGHEMLETATDEVSAGGGTILGPGVSRRVDNGGFAADTPGADAALVDPETGEEMIEESASDETEQPGPNSSDPPSG